MTDEFIDYLEECDRMRERIKELEDGACRFNCATRKKAFMAGFDAGAKDAAESGVIIDEDFYKEVTEKAYKEWKREQG